MALRIVRTAPRSTFSLKRGALYVVGMLLVLTGLLLAAVPFLFFVLGALAWLSGKPGPDLDVGEVVKLLLSLALGASAVIGGARLVRGRRQLVLFLRRFGFAAATHALSFSVATAMGQRWRLVTLDDAALVPVGVRRRSKVVASAIGLIMIVAAGAALYWAFGEGSKSLVSDTFASVAKPEPGDDLNTSIGRIFGAAIAAFIAGVMLFAVVFIGTAFAGVGAVLSLGIRFTIARAERRTLAQVSSADAARTLAQSAAAGARRIFAPRLSVVRATHDVWQETVLQLAQAASVVIIDISEPSANLRWEIETLKRVPQCRYLLVGEQARVDRLNDAARSSAAGEEAALLSLLEGEECLVYSRSEAGDMKRFARVLRARLELLRQGAADAA